MPGHGVIPIRTQARKPVPAMPRRFDKDRRNKYARSAQAWLALVAQAAQRRTTTYDALLLSHPLTLRSDLDPIDDYCNEHGLPPLAVVCVDRKTGEPSRGNVGVFPLDKNRERVFNYDWFALVPPTPRRKSGRPTWPGTRVRPPRSGSPDRYQKDRNGADPSPRPTHAHRRLDA